MQRATLEERYARRFDLGDPKAKKDQKALQSLLKGGSIAQAAVASGWSERTLYNRGIIRRFAEHLEGRERDRPNEGG